MLVEASGLKGLSRLLVLLLSNFWNLEFKMVRVGRISFNSK